MIPYISKVYAQGATIVLPDEGADTISNLSTLSSLVNFVINLVFGIGLALSLVFVIVGGIKYITSQGNQDKAEEARNTITNAIIGAVVIIAFRVILSLALNILGVTEGLGEFFGGGSSGDTGLPPGAI